MTNVIYILQRRSKKPDKDIGPTPGQVQWAKEGVDDSEDIRDFGIYHTSLNSYASEQDKLIATRLHDACEKQGLETPGTILWPTVSSTPVAEYHEKVLTKAFPWLFPGGIGDFLDSHEKEVSIDVWVKIMITYFDGRFAKDKAFSFFALNYMT